MKLNPRQQEAVLHADGPLLVLAGAGSGKTRVIVQKIRHLVRNGHVDADRMFAVTFTNKTTQEMKARLARLLGESQYKALSVSTFHRLGLRIVRSHLDVIHRHAGITLLDPTDATGAIAEILREQGWEDAGGSAVRKTAAQVQAVISRHKNAGRTADAVTPSPDPIETIAALCYPLYEAHLQACNALDLDDLVLKPVALMRSHPDIAQAWQQQIGYLMVDEYQDTNHAQYELLRLLRPHAADGARPFMVVGDDDQSIYAWRGADPRNLRRLADDYPDLTVVKLEDNYRCTPDILSIANAVIARNPHIFPKTLRAARDDGQPVRLVASRESQHEADLVASEITTRRAQANLHWGGFAVLFRSKHQARALELAFRRFAVPYQLSGSQSLFDRTEVKDAIAYLRVLLNSRDDAALLRIINVPRRNIGTKALGHLTQFAQQHRLSLLDAARHPEFAASGAPRQTGPVRELAGMLDDAAAAIAESGVNALRDLLARVGYRGWLDSQSDTEDGAKSRWNALQALLGHLERATAAGTSGAAALQDALTQLTLRELDNDSEPAADQVQLMTIHAAKGLEFPHVYLVGLEDGLLPHANSQDTEAGIEEERRLFYVAMTRAMETLTLSYARERRQHGELVAQEPSRFLDEIPPELLIRQGEAAETSEERQQQTQARLSGLKALLD